MRPIIKTVKWRSPGVPLEYKPWGDAKPVLAAEIGKYCSYCERYNSLSALEVEHLHAKDIEDAAGVKVYNHLKYRWDNFLLACKNCNTTKSKKDIATLSPYLPHENNLLEYIEIDVGGTIKIKAGIAGIELRRTQSFIDLVGLDRHPGHPDYSNKDDRWDTRLKVYEVALKQFNKYTAVPQATDIDTIIDLASFTGFFSVWYYTFIGEDDVIEALLRCFTGTAIAFFDAANNYRTLPRP